MNGFIQNIQGVERLNQSVAVLGGATAQSYSAENLFSQADLATELSAPILWSAGDIEEFGSGMAYDFSNPALEKSLLEDAVPPAGPVSVQPSMLEGQPSLPVVTEDVVGAVSEMMSRFQEFEQSSTSGLNVLPAGESGDSGESESLDTTIDGFLLSDFLAEIVEQAEESQEEFGSKFDGESQIDLLDPLTDPLLTFNYDGGPAVLIDSVLDFAVQSISSASFPSIGPLVSNQQDELTALVA